jgi:hypothetical protein
MKAMAALKFFCTTTTPLRLTQKKIASIAGLI